MSAAIVRRRLRLLLELAGSPRGLSTRRLADRLGASRATVDRDLREVRDGLGLPVERYRVGGEVWHRYAEPTLAAIAQTRRAA